MGSTDLLRSHVDVDSAAVAARHRKLLGDVGEALAAALELLSPKNLHIVENRSVIT